MTDLKWVIVPPEEVEAYYRNRCPVRRGPRSTVQCEQDTRTHAEFHAGRGARGQWFTWSEEVDS